jgi:vacuolar-type H+-ATPase subunit C/Vma6
MTGISEILEEIAGQTGLNSGQIIIGSLALLLIILLILVAFMGYFRILVHIASFAYPVARVRALGNPFVREEELATLAESHTLHELREKIQDHGFDLKLEEAAPLRDLDQVLDRYELNELSLFLDSVPDSIRPFFTAFRSLPESEQLKTAIRCRHAGLHPEIIRDRMIPVGIVTPELIDGCAHSEKVDDIVSLLQETIYGKALAESLLHYHEQGSTLPLERALDLTALQEINHSRTRIDNLLAGPVREFCGIYTDITNILTVLRARTEGLDPAEASLSIVSGGAFYEDWRMRQLLETPSIPEILHQLSGTEYFDAISGALPLYEETASVHLLEHELERYLLKKVGILSSTYHLTGGPLIRFIVARFIEIRNIRVLIHAFHGRIPVAAISGELVTEGGIV